MKYLNLASGAAHFLSPKAAVEQTIAALQNNETFYREVAGLPVLREAIAGRYLQDYEARIPVENIMVTTGTKHAIFTLFSVLLQPGDEVIMPLPSWFGFTEIFKVLQIKAVFLETSPEENYTIDPEKLQSLITDKTKLFIYSNPGNPTGKVYTKTEIESWLEVFKKHPQIKILSDEIYDLIVYDDAKIPSLLQFPDAQQKHLIVNGFSKNYGMSGWRVGYLIAPPEIMQKCLHFQQVTISGVNPFVQEGAAATLKHLPEFMPERISELARNREILCSGLNKNPLISYFKPQAAYYVFADLNKLLQSENLKQKGLTTSEKFCHYLQQEWKLELLPGEKFNSPGFVRITFAVTENDLREALTRIETFLNKS